MCVLDQARVQDDQLQCEVLAFPGTVAVHASRIQAAAQQALGVEDRCHRAAQAEVGRQEVLLTMNDQRLRGRQGRANAIGAHYRLVPPRATTSPDRV